MKIIMPNINKVKQIQINHKWIKQIIRVGYTWSNEVKSTEKSVQKTKINYEIHSRWRADNILVLKRTSSAVFLLPVLTYGCKTWTAHKVHLSRIRAVEKSFLRMAVAVQRKGDYSNREVHEKMRMEEWSLSANCGVSEWTRSTLWWHGGHVQKSDS